MPERKGSKRKSPRARRSAGDQPGIIRAEAATGEDIAPSPRAQRPVGESTIPALRARYAGFIVGVLTLTIGVLTLAQGVVGDYGTADAAVRVGAGGALIALAVVIGVLALVPGRVAAWFRRH